MAGGYPSNDEVDALLNEPKVITANLSWRAEGRRFKLEATVLAKESGVILKLYVNVGIRNRSIALLLRNIRIRGFCTNPNHRNPLRIPVRSPHKHTYDELWGDDSAYVPDDITVGDVNAELLGFMKECNITLEGTYQTLQVY